MTHSSEDSNITTLHQGYWYWIDAHFPKSWPQVTGADDDDTDSTAQYHPPIRECAVCGSLVRDTVSSLGRHQSLHDGVNYGSHDTIWSPPGEEWQSILGPDFQTWSTNHYPMAWSALSGLTGTFGTDDHHPPMRECVDCAALVRDDRIPLNRHRAWHDKNERTS